MDINEDVLAAPSSQPQHGATLGGLQASSGALQGAACSGFPPVQEVPSESANNKCRPCGRTGALTPEQRTCEGGAEEGGQRYRQQEQQAWQQADEQCLQQISIDTTAAPHHQHDQQQQLRQQQQQEQGGAGQPGVSHLSSKTSADQAPCIAGTAPREATPGLGSDKSPSPPAKEHSSCTDLKQPVQEAECRICLSCDTPDSLVSPCKCTGSVRYAHLSCLLRWCKERVSTQCEICGATYRPEVLPLLEPAVGEARQQLQAMQREMDRVRRSLRQQANESAATATTEGRHASSTSSPGSEQPGARRASNWLILKVLLVVAVMGALLYALFFLGSENDSGALWAEILLRILIFVIPLYLVYQGIRACLAHRARVVASREARHSEQEPTRVATLVAIV